MLSGKGAAPRHFGEGLPFFGDLSDSAAESAVADDILSTSV